MAAILKLIETFSGIGAQAQALKNIGAEFKVVATSEWEIGAIYAYDIIHNGKQDLKKYRHHTKESLIDILSKYNLSGDGKKPLTEKSISGMSLLQLKRILAAIERTNNLVDISEVHAENLPDGDILTYSFPCQDLSAAGFWHHNEGGIDRDAQNRSSLLWQIDRILKEYVQEDKKLPNFLLMENVSNILSKRHIKNFNEWCRILEGMGYVNAIYTLDARNFGVPQSRVRTYMLSVMTNDENRDSIQEYLDLNNLEDVSLPDEKIRPLKDYLKLDYSNEKYLKEAIASTPKFTKSRAKIYENNPILAIDDKVIERYSRTVTTKQDRNPNSGIIKTEKYKFSKENEYYRNLTPRECFLLMGFDEESFDQLVDNNFEIRKNRTILPDSKLIRLAGNSIAVPVLESIFKQVEQLNNIIKKESE